MNWEFRFMKYIDRHINNAVLDKIFRLCSALANYGIFFIICIGIMFLNQNTRKMAMVTAVSMTFSAILINVILKPLFSRQRPFLVDESIEPLIKRPIDMSFPSGHTSAAFTFATAVYLQSRPPGIISYIFAVLVGMSRIYLQVHYPTDVITGAAVGIFVSGIVNKVLS